MVSTAENKFEKWKDELEREKRLLENQINIAEAELKMIQKKMDREENLEELERKFDRFKHYTETKKSRLLNVEVLIDEIIVNKELRS